MPPTRNAIIGAGELPAGMKWCGMIGKEERAEGQIKRKTTLTPAMAPNMLDVQEILQDSNYLMKSYAKTTALFGVVLRSTPRELAGCCRAWRVVFDRILWVHVYFDGLMGRWWVCLAVLHSYFSRCMMFPACYSYILWFTLGVFIITNARRLREIFHSGDILVDGDRCMIIDM
jgi:hypothetical protein